MNEQTKKISMYIGMRLSEQRKKRRFTLADLAQRVNLSPQQLQRYEGGHSMITANRLYQLAEALCVDTHYFFNGFSEFNARMKSTRSNATLSSSAPALNIMLIEDDEKNAYCTRKALDQNNIKCNLLVMRDNLSVLRFLRNQTTSISFPRPDLILLRVPHLKRDGITLLRELKQDRTLSDIPIVILTQSIDTQEMVTCYQNYAAGYMCASFNFEQNIKELISYWTHLIVFQTQKPLMLKTGVP